MLDSAPPRRNRGQSPPIFGPFLLWPNGWMHQNATWYGDRPRPRPHCARWGPSSPPQKGTHSPISAHVSCGQTAGRIQMPLGTEVGVGPCDSVRWGPSFPPKGAQPSPICGQTAVCIRIPLGTEVGLSLGDIVLDGNPAPPPPKVHSSPIFGPCPLWPNGWMD